MTRNMLINATSSEELRIAVVTDGRLDRYEVAAGESGLYRGNIYRGLVANIQPSLGGAFVDIGVERDGLLRAEDVVPPAYSRKTDERRPRIEKILERNQPVLVQVSRDGVGTKGSLLTTNLSLAGRYLVLMPYDEVRGVSRKAEEDEVRKKIRDRLKEMKIPEGFGVIARTNALDQPKATLNRDLNALLRLWKKIRKEANTGKGTRLLYSDQDLLIQALRDFLDNSIQEVVVDDDDAFAKAQGYMASFMPRARTKLVRYSDRMPIFSRYKLEEQIDRISLRQVPLPSGGSIVIDGTEALTAIDVNSGRATRGASQEETAYNTNKEAAVEVARQLRMRDIGGLMVVDFIDMRSNKHQRDVEKALRDAMKDDKARHTVSRISANGLLEINRQRMKKALTLRTHRQCPTCGGSGAIASPDHIGLNLLRRIETRAVTGQLKGVRISLHPELADAIQNERRQDLAELEREFDLRIEIIAATGLHRSEEKIEWSRKDDKDDAGRKGSTAAVSAADLAQGLRPAKPGKAAQPSTDDDRNDGGDDQEGGEKTSRRRRRGGRRRKKAPPKTEEGTSTAAAGSGEAEAAPSDEEKPKAKRRPRRRRSSRSRKPKETAGENTEATSSPEPTPEQPAAEPESVTTSSARKTKKRPWWKRITLESNGGETAD